jgi:hypothetical protein
VERGYWSVDFLFFFFLHTLYQLRIGTKSVFEFHNYRSVLFHGIWKLNKASEITLWACIFRAPTTLKSEGEVTSLLGADKREVRDNREKWWEYREKSKYFSNCTTFTFTGHYRGISYVIMYLLSIKVYSVVV